MLICDDLDGTLLDTIPAAAAVGYVTEKQDNWIILE